MSKKLGVVVALMAVCALSLFLLNCGSSSSRPSGVLYVLTQGINGAGNSISSFAINLGSGNLSLINSNAQTCATPNACGLPLDILLDPAGSVAFVLNQGSPCTPTPPTCTPSGTTTPPTINSYKVGSDGSLSAPSTAATLTAGDTAIAMTRDAAGNFLFVITASPQLLVYSMTPGSTSLTLASSLTLTKAPTALSAITFTPTGSTAAQEYLYVSNNFDYCTVSCNPPHNDNTVSAYTVSSSGTLTEQPNSPYAIAATDPISVVAVNTNPPAQNTGGIFVYVGNQDPNGGHVYPFQVCTVVGNNGCTQIDVQNNLMTPLATCPQISCDVPPANVGQKPVAMLVDPTNNFLYVVSEGSNTVYGFRINTTSGTFTALTPASQPTGSQPVALALKTPVGSSPQFLYVSNSTSSNITGFNVSTTTGSMNNPITVVSPSNPSGMVAR